MIKKDYYDVIIVGGGASGLATAINIKHKCKSAKIAVFEQLDRVGKKLIVTGNGRCNITNRDIDISRYHGKNVGFFSEILNNYGPNETEKFFKELGLYITFEDNGKGFPMSFQASSVVDVLRFECQRQEINVVCNCTAKDYNHFDKHYSVVTSEGTVNCRYLVIATSLLSGGKKLGSSGEMLKIMQSKGYSVVPLSPAIVQLKTETDTVKALKGIKINAKVSLKASGKTVRNEYGEVLFTDYGLSGPPVLQISGEAIRIKGEKFAVLDLLPDISFNEITDILKERRKIFADSKAETFFVGMFNRLLGQALLKKANIKLDEQNINITDDKIKLLANTIKNFSFKITGDKGFDNSQVTSGGLNTDNFNTRTLESKIESDLFVTGEILDIYGDCGGFNLQWAWASADAVASEITRRIHNA